MEIIDVLKFFGIDGVKSYKLFGTGNINTTYLVTTKGGRYLLQKMNATALPDIYGALKNIEVVTNHLSRKGERTLKLMPTITGKNSFEDSDGYVYRMYPFIENSVSYDITGDPNKIREIAFAFGKFDGGLKDLDPKKLVISDPGFHNTKEMYNLLEKAIEDDPVGRVKSATDTITVARGLISKALSCGIDVFGVVKAKERGQLPLRVVHNDTKLNNCLLSKDSGKYLAVIDLDTCMPSTILNDYGDGVRANTNATIEEETDLRKVKLDMKKFKAFTEGFLDGFGAVNLNNTEKKLLLTSCIAITFELGTRFLRDYLEGDRFFRIRSDNAKFNLMRANVQFKFMDDMLLHIKEMEKIINDSLQICDYNTKS